MIMLIFLVTLFCHIKSEQATGLTREWTGVQFFLEVVDYDGQQRTGELVRRVVHNIFSNNITLGVETEPQNFSYPDPPVRSSIVLSFKVVCAENYYSQNCSRFCTENCVCDPGFTGEFCHKIDDCYEVDCGTNHQCIDYYGQSCALLCTDNISCSGHGQCVDEGNSYSCVCDPNFIGETCLEELLLTTETETQALGRNFNLKAVLGGTIGALIVEMTQVPTVTINNMAYEGVTSNNEETDGDIHYSNINGKAHAYDDVPVYECI